MRKNTMAPRDPLFILAAPRSFSSLVSAMIGQHPEMYGLPELNLFVADDIQGLILYCEGRLERFELNGLLRVTAQLEFGDQSQENIEKARRWINERRSWSSEKMFHHIMSAVAPRMCVEKSPSTVLEWSHLARLRKIFPSSNFLHLIRHPVDCCNSIYKFAQDIDREYGGFLSFLMEPERTWVTSNTNILAFTESRPSSQVMRIHGEQFMAESESLLINIARWLGVATSAKAIECMLHPENSPYAKMGPPNAPLANDPQFLRDPVFRPQRHRVRTGVKLLEWNQRGYLARPTRELAHRLGYSEGLSSSSP